MTVVTNYAPLGYSSLGNLNANVSLDAGDIDLVYPSLRGDSKITCGAGVPPALCSRDGRTTNHQVISEASLGSMDPRRDPASPDLTPHSERPDESHSAAGSRPSDHVNGAVGEHLLVDRYFRSRRRGGSGLKIAAWNS